MTEKDILAELLTLLAEQMDALRKELTPDRAIRYADRQERIKSLVERITQEHFK